MSVIAAGFVEVAWILLQQGGIGTLPKETMFTVVETYVTLGLVFEICIRASVQWRRFFQSVANVVDAAVAAISVTSSLLLASGLETKTEMLVAESLVIGRVLFRLLRLLAITKAFQRQQAAADRKLEVNLDDTLPMYDVPGTPVLSGDDHIFSSAGTGDASPFVEPFSLSGSMAWGAQVESAAPHRKQVGRDRAEADLLLSERRLAGGDAV